MKKIFSKIFSFGAIMALSLQIFFPLVATAAAVTSFSDTMSSEKASTASNHTFLFTAASNLTNSTGVMTITFPGGFDLSTMAFGDLDYAVGTTACSVGGGGTFTEQTLVASGATGAQLNATISGQTVNFAASTAPTAISGVCVRIKMGTNASFGTTGTHQITNSTAATYTISLSGTNYTDTGTLAISIADDTAVNVTATVGQSITFDLNAGYTNASTVAPYSVALGGLSVANASNSDNATINSIWANISSNGGSGVVVTVQSLNGALKSSSVPADTIPSATGTMTAGVANYGICVGSVSQTSGATLTAASPFNGATCTSGHSNTVGVVTTSAANILTASSGIVGGVSEIRVNAENSTATVAHTDYADTLTFIATTTF